MAINNIQVDVIKFLYYKYAIKMILMGDFNENFAVLEGQDFLNELLFKGIYIPTIS